jgi:predicted Fe-S protein YdhL (DUF1289 family)
MLQPQPIVSPCIRVCELDERGICRGCYRTLEEIGAWSRLSAVQQRLIIGQLPARAASMPAAR